MGMWQNYFLESDSNTKEINSRKKNANSQPNIAVFSASRDSENKIIQILHRKGEKVKLERIVIVRTGTYHCQLTGDNILNVFSLLPADW